MSQQRFEPDDSSVEELEHLLTHGIRPSQPSERVTPTPSASTSLYNDEEDEDDLGMPGGDLQGGIGLFAEAAQDMATAALELSLGRHFACADFCNQAAEKAAQAVSLLQFGRRSPYDHDLRALAILVGAPVDIQEKMAVLTPFHPEAFYANTPPEEADEIISAEQAADYEQQARAIIRWARTIILRP